MFGLYAAGLDIMTHGIALDFKAFDPGLVVVLNKRAYPGTRQPMRFEVYDRNAPGGPKWQLVLRVPLREDGSLRQPDRRDLEAVMRARGWAGNVDRLMNEMDATAERRERAIEREHKNLAAAMADDMKYAGRRITDTVESRNRTREAIRRAAFDGPEAA